MITNFNGTIVCASKYFDADEIRILYQKGVHDFGENKVQDFLKKVELLKDLDITWHFIGHLQSNKVKDMINHVSLLHTLDRFSVAKEIQKHANQSVNCLIQVNLTEEDQKSGVNPDNLDQFLLEIKKYDKINIVGFMTMGKLDDLEMTEIAFKKLDELANLYHLPYRSMGMTDDYEIAIKHHATHLRIGRKFKEML
ncbi:MAG: YggS family pyridoxal phosphate-dependent enzyme [Acholeplasmataceae bacterium]|jgi:pyridoxal phosphate enzyme (YggS family)|nr:YggS family pyridoxal phosphate-dependent enzyme [Acholeplasmataceae bacterium]